MTKENNVLRVAVLPVPAFREIALSLLGTPRNDRQKNTPGAVYCEVRSSLWD